MTVREALIHLPIKRTAVYQAIADRRIPATRFGRAIRLTAETVAVLVRDGIPPAGEVVR